MNRHARRASKKRTVAVSNQASFRQLDGPTLIAFRTATALLRQEQWIEAELAHEAILEVSPTHAQCLHHLGIIAYKRKNSEKAIQLLEAALTSEPLLHNARLHLAAVLNANGRPGDAMKHCQEVLAYDQKNSAAYCELGNCSTSIGRSEEALEFYRLAVRLSPDNLDVAMRVAECELATQDYVACVRSCCTVLAVDATNQRAQRVLASVIVRSDDELDPRVWSSTTLKSDGHIVDLISEMALSRHLGGDSAGALRDLERAQRRYRHAAELWICQATIFHGLGELQSAFEALKFALGIDGENQKGYQLLGRVLVAMGANSGAVTALRRAAELGPSSASTHNMLASVLHAINQDDEAFRSLETARNLNPHCVTATVAYCSIRRYLCDWDGLDELEARVIADLRLTADPVPPFQMLGMLVTNADLRFLGERYSEKIKATAGIRPANRESPIGGNAAKRIRVGYLSSDFYNHATSTLIVELLERHDRERFETFAYCHSPDDGSDLRQRVIRSFEHFTTIGHLSNQAAVDRIRSDGIEILIDLKGHTHGARHEILALRAAPIQVAYLGYPSTTGATYIDYFIADEIVAPNEHQCDYTEKLVHLRTCYQPTDSKRKPMPTQLTRAEAGLPENGFVFCTFNNNFKLNRQFFYMWMDLLHRVPGSCLWLLPKSPAVQVNLIKEAESCGIDPSRLIFAERLSSEKHLARLALADLFLDSLPCSAHTTASDAIWAGLPVLTCLGGTFAGRVAASVLTSCGLSQLIAESLEEYRAIALRLAHNASEMVKLKDYMRNEVHKSLLFDSQAYTREFEGALTHMSRRRRRGLEPKGFAVSDADCSPEVELARGVRHQSLGSTSEAIAASGNLLAQVESCLEAGQNDKAAELCGQVLALDPKNHMPFLHLAKLAELAGATRKAAEFVSEAIIRNPECGDAYLHLSRLFRAMGDLKTAAQALSAAIAIGKAGSEALLDLANLFYEAGDVASATNAYRSVLAKNPTCKTSQAMLSLLTRKDLHATGPMLPSSRAELPTQWRKVNLCLLAPPGNSHWHAFSDLADGIAHAFRELGADCSIKINEIQSDKKNIVFGAHLIPNHEMARSISGETIVFNLEQIDGFGLQRYPVYRDLLAGRQVWDYSPRNLTRISQLTGNSNIHLMKVGYAASLERIGATSEEATDVLFYGSLNERRKAVLDQLIAEGVSVKHLFNVYGAERDAEIRRAKLVLNMHYYSDSIHEIVRTSVLLANRKAVVTECNVGTEIDEDLRSAMQCVPYDHLVEACVTLVRDAGARNALADAAYDIFSTRKQVDCLRDLIVDRPSHH